MNHTDKILARAGQPCSTDKCPVCMCVSASVSELVKSSQVTFIYIALLTIQIVSKHLTVSNWRIECQ